MPIIAFWLGVLSIPLFFFLGEGLGLPVLVPGIVAYFFICQFMLSRGTVDACREDWPTMLALEAAPLMLVSAAILGEKRSVVVAQACIILIPSCAGAFAGAWTASRLAHRAGVRH